MVLIGNNGNYGTKLLANITALQSDLDANGLIVSLPKRQLHLHSMRV